MPTYSFQDVNATITGPGGSFALGSSAGVAKEGITLTRTADKNKQTIGADGDVMNSLIAGKPGRATVRLLKTSPTNALLSTMYALQESSSSLWGQNLIVISNPQTGDVGTCQQCAFTKYPDITNAEEAGTQDWVFDVGVVDQILGTGSPSAT